jgi:outer membrane protein OmpA-like peptidoglycan-associated protein
MRKSLFIIALSAFAVGSTACASKGYVNTQVGATNKKVDTLSQSLEETQERTRQNEGKIGEVDQKAGAARTAADNAQKSATQAGQAASAADAKAVAAADAARMASAKADEIDKASKRLVYEVVLSEDSGGFKFGNSNLPDEAKAQIDQLISRVMADPKGAYFEIEGHTDNVGEKAINERIGLARAESVKRYLYEQHKIPLHRMNVVSYGEDRPIDGNKTAAARKANRRVVIRVLV